MASNNPGSSNNIAGALTFPDRSTNDNLQPVPEQPRQPRTLQGLLRFAMEATKAEDAPATAGFGPMDEERRAFLDNALRAHTIRLDEILSRNIEILTDKEKMSSLGPNAELTQEIDNAFLELSEYIDDIDVANDFEKMGGFAAFPLAYSSENLHLWRSANLLLAQVCQNNPHCQRRALACMLPHLLLQRRRRDDRTVRALSSIVRNFPEGTAVFVSHGGCELVVDALQQPQLADFTSAVFLVPHLITNSKEAREIFIKSNIVQTVADLLKQRLPHAAEHLLNILVTLIEVQPDVVSIYRDPTLDLSKILEDHLKLDDVQNGRYIEEKEACEKLLHLIRDLEVKENGVPQMCEDVEAADR